MEVTPEQQFKLMYVILFSLASSNGGRYRIPLSADVRPDGMLLEENLGDNSITVHITPETIN
jgi:hypothetical protein